LALLLALCLICSLRIALECRLLRRRSRTKR